MRLTVSSCRTCRAEIVWAQTENGQRIPLDAAPYDGDSPRGLFVFRRHLNSVYVVAATPDAFAGEQLYRSHFATCPDAADHRRSG